MPKFLFAVRYSLDGAKGLLKEGGSKRRAVVEKATAEVGGTVESFYFSFGKEDALVITDLPDTVTAAAVSLAVSASGVGSVSTTALLTPEEIDGACQKAATSGYKAPGA